MEGTKRILSIVMATVMVLSVFAGLAVIPASAYTSASVLNDSIVMGQKLHISLTGTAETITVKAIGVSGDAEGQVVILYSGTPTGATLQLETKDIITKSGEYNVTVTNSTATLGYRVVAVSEPVLTAKLNDATAGKDDVSSFIKGHTVYINGTSNAGIEYVRVYDSNNVIKFEAKTSVNYTGGINYWVLADDSGRTLSGLGKGTYTLEVKDKVGTKITKTFEVVGAEITLNVPATVVLGNKVTIRGTTTDTGKGVDLEIKGPVGTVKELNKMPQSNGVFTFTWYAGSNKTDTLQFPSGKSKSDLTGSYSIKVTINGTDTSASGTIQVVAPELTVSAPEEVVVAKKFTISGTSNRDEGTQIYVVVKHSNDTVSWNSSAIGNASVESDGTWEIDIPATAIPIEDTYTIKVYQDYGVSQLKVEQSVTVEAKKPTVSISAPDEVAMNNKVVITGSISPNVGSGVTVNITITDKSNTTNKATYQVQTDADGNFRFEWNTKTQDPAGADTTGTYEIEAKLTDYGQPSAKTTVRLTDPEIKILEAPATAIIGKEVKIKVWYDQPDGAQIKVYVDDSPVTVTGNTTDDKEATIKWTPTKAAGFYEGTYNIKVVGCNSTGAELSNVFDVTTIELTEQSVALVVPESVVAGEEAEIVAYTQVGGTTVNLKISGNNIPTLSVSGTSKTTKETSGDYAGWYKVVWATGSDKYKWNTAQYDKLSSDDSRVLHIAPGTYTVELTDTTTGNKVTDEITVVNPTLTLTSPEDGKSFAIGDDVIISGTTNKEDGTRIYIYVTSADGNYDQEFIVTTANGEFEKTWKTSGRTAGEYTIKVVYKWFDGTTLGGKSVTTSAKNSDDVVAMVTIELKPAVADIQVTSVSVSPSEVKVKENATVTVVVKNLGVAEGTETITLSVNGVVTVQEEVTLGAGESKTLTFEVTKDEPGTYTIDVNGVSKTFTVKEEVKPTETATATPTPTPTQPGFEAVFAIVGLLAVAYLVLRQREE